MLWKFDIINSKTEVCCIKLHKKIPIILISCFKYSIIAKNETFYQILSLYQIKVSRCIEMCVNHIKELLIMRKFANVSGKN